MQFKSGGNQCSEMIMGRTRENKKVITIARIVGRNQLSPGIAAKEAGEASTRAKTNKKCFEPILKTESRKREFSRTIELRLLNFLIKRKGMTRLRLLLCLST